MLKTCWDCLMGPTGNRNQVENEDSYGIRLNGDAQRAPPWPSEQSDDGKMFLLPRKLVKHDEIIVSVNLTDNPTRLFIGFGTDQYQDQPETLDFNNTACYADINFAEDRLIIQPGSTEETINHDFGMPFQIRFQFDYNYYGKPRMRVSRGDMSDLGDIILEYHEASIRYLLVKGDARSINLTFEYGKV